MLRFRLLILNTNRHSNRLSIYQLFFKIGHDIKFYKKELKLQKTFLNFKDIIKQNTSNKDLYTLMLFAIEIFCFGNEKISLC